MGLSEITMKDLKARLESEVDHGNLRRDRVAEAMRYAKEADEQFGNGDGTLTEREWRSFREMTSHDSPSISSLFGDSRCGSYKDSCMIPIPSPNEREESPRGRFASPRPSGAKTREIVSSEAERDKMDALIAGLKSRGLVLNNNGYFLQDRDTVAREGSNEPLGIIVGFQCAPVAGPDGTKRPGVVALVQGDDGCVTAVDVDDLSPVSPVRP